MDNKKDFWIDTYQRNVSKLIGVCYRYVSNETVAEDLVHDSFLKAMNKAGSFEGKGHFDAWLRKICVNEALQYLRDQKKQSTSQDELIHQTLIENHGDMFNNYDFTTKELLDAIEQLPEHHRQVFNLYVLDGYSHQQIANNLGIEVGTSKSHLSRAKKKLQQILNKKKNRSIFLLLFPCGFGKITRTYKKHFNEFKIDPKNKDFLNQIDWNETKEVTFSNKSIHLILLLSMFTVALSLMTVFMSKNKSEDKGIESIENLIGKDSSQHHNPAQKENFIEAPNDSVDTNFQLNMSLRDQIDTDQNKPVVIRKKRIVRKKMIIHDTLKITQENDQ